MDVGNRWEYFRTYDFYGPPEPTVKDTGIRTLEVTHKRSFADSIEYTVDVKDSIYYHSVAHTVIPVPDTVTHYSNTYPIRVVEYADHSLQVFPRKDSSLARALEFDSLMAALAFATRSSPAYAIRDSLLRDGGSHPVYLFRSPGSPIPPPNGPEHGPWYVGLAAVDIGLVSFTGGQDRYPHVQCNYDLFRFNGAAFGPNPLAIRPFTQRMRAQVPRPGWLFRDRNLLGRAPGAGAAGYRSAPR